MKRGNYSASSSDMLSVDLLFGRWLGEAIGLEDEYINRLDCNLVEVTLDLRSLLYWKGRR